MVTDLLQVIVNTAVTTAIAKKLLTCKQHTMLQPQKQVDRDLWHCLESTCSCLKLAKYYLNYQHLSPQITSQC
jgi:hypothetical protein